MKMDHEIDEVLPKESEESHSVEDDVDDDDDDEDDEDDEDDSTIQERLLECLDEIQTAGSFAAFKEVAAALNPELHVNGLGVIGLPLNEVQVEALRI